MFSLLRVGLLVTDDRFGYWWIGDFEFCFSGFWWCLVFGVCLGVRLLCNGLAYAGCLLRVELGFGVCLLF